MSGWLFVIVFLILFAIILLVVSIGLNWTEREQKRKVKEMLRTVADIRKLEDAAILQEGARTGNTFLSSLPIYGNIKRQLDLGETQMTPEIVIGLMVAFAFGGALLGTRVQTPVMREGTILILGILGGFLPYFFVSFRAKKRMEAFEELFPEALDFLARSMRAGHAFSVSLEMMAEETPDPVGTEFKRLFHEQNLGAALETTLRNFGLRIPLLDTKMFVSAVLLQRETGGNLAEILTKIAYIIRERFRLKGQVRAASAHGRITAVILSVMPIVTLVLLNVIAPQYFQMMLDDKDGRWIVVAVVALQLIGYYWMRKIINIKV